MSNPKKIPEYLGYNFTSPILGSSIPQRLQNLCIRDYAKQKNLLVTFNVAEWWDAERSLMLFSQFDHAKNFNGFIFYSLTILPTSAELRRSFYALVQSSKMTVHFALEDLSAKSGSEFQEIERMFLMATAPQREAVRRHWISRRPGQKSAK